jgi:archaellum component FlaC
MGFLDFLQKIFGKKAQPQAIQSELQSFQSPQSLIESQINQSIIKSPEESSIELEKDSLQLGIAAGYTGKFIKEIESSLNRIESQMVSKDWFAFQFEDHTPELIDVMKQHEENDQKRFEAIQNLLNSLQKTAERAPEPIKTDLFRQIQTIESQLPLTPKMLDLLNVVREFKEISYNDLADKLNITQNALRGLLSLTVRRTNKIERFEKDGKGWIRFVSD